MPPGGGWRRRGGRWPVWWARDPKLVTFTSGGTEANNTVLTPDWRLGSEPHRANFLLVGATEHVSVLAGGRFVPERVREIPVDADGVINLDSLRRTLEGLAAEEARPLVSVMLANNETGVIQPMADIAEIAHRAGAIVHTDAVQAAGRIPVDIDSARRRCPHAIGPQDRRPARGGRHRPGVGMAWPSPRF